jgi:succinate-acetate transporter protein
MSVILASCTNMMSVVFPAMFSRVSRAFILLFMLCDMMHRVAADDVLLCISGYVGVIGVCLSWGCHLCSLLCFLDNCYFHRASRIIRCIGIVSMAGSGAVGTA